MNGEQQPIFFLTIFSENDSNSTCLAKKCVIILKYLTRDKNRPCYIESMKFFGLKMLVEIEFYNLILANNEKYRESYFLFPLPMLRIGIRPTPMEFGICVAAKISLVPPNFQLDILHRFHFVKFQSKISDCFLNSYKFLSSG